MSKLSPNLFCDNGKPAPSRFVIGGNRAEGDFPPAFKKRCPAVTRFPASKRGNRESCPRPQDCNLIYKVDLIKMVSTTNKNSQNEPSGLIHLIYESQGVIPISTLAACPIGGQHETTNTTQ